MTKSYPIIFFALTIIIVFVFFFPSIFYLPKAYDEITIFKESYLPVPVSFHEMLELISSLGLNYCFEATNTLYSSIVSMRCNPFGNLLMMLTLFIFKKNTALHHIYALSLHLICTGFVFLILNKVGVRYGEPLLREKGVPWYAPTIAPMLTLFWALHPVNIESVLLITNVNSILGHAFCLLTIFIYLNSNQYKNNLLTSILLFLTYIFALFITEYNFILPFIIVAYTTAIDLYTNKSKTLLTAIKDSIIKAAPTFYALTTFVLFFLFSITGINTHIQSSLKLVLERIFWLSPQIIFHLTKLFFFPAKLSIDQSFLVKIGKSLFDPYSIFCIFFIVVILILSIISLINSKKRFPFFFVTFFLFFLSLIPFSQILAPTYNLASERYLYFPSFIFVFGASHFIFSRCKGTPWRALTLTLLVVLGLSTRAYFRMLDWKDSFSLYYSCIKATDNPLYKAYRYKNLTPQEKILSQYPENEVDIKYKKLALKNFKKAINILKKEEEKYQVTIPSIVKSYGLDPKTLLVKSGYLLAKSDFSLNKDIQRTLKIIKPYTKDPLLLDSAGLSFYASLLYNNNLLDKAERVINTAYKKDSYSLQAIYLLCDLIQIKYSNIEEVERIALRAFSYYPYDTAILFLLKKIYELKGEHEKYSWFSHAYALRTHLIQNENKF